MLVVGLTGGIATGKSTVSNILKTQFDYPVIDADVIAREVVEPGKPAYNAIVDYFGGITPHLVKDDGSRELNRPALGQSVFGNDTHRKVLNSIVHPAVRKAIAWAVISYWLRGYKLVILDVPLLFESKLDRFTGLNVAVLCDGEVQYQRLTSRDPHLSEQDARERIASQIPLKTKRELADIVIENDGSMQELEEKLRQFSALKSMNPSFLLTLLQWVPPIGLLWGLYVYWVRTRPGFLEQRKPLIGSRL